MDGKMGKGGKGVCHGIDVKGGKGEEEVAVWWNGLWVAAGSMGVGGKGVRSIL